VSDYVPSQAVLELAGAEAGEAAHGRAG
jgi:hypothetical protein